MEYYSAIKKNEILPFATTWLDLEGFTLSETSQRKTNTALYYLNVESKNNTNELIYKIETDSQILKSNVWLPKRKCGGKGQIRRLGLTYTTTIYKIDN